MRIGLISDTHGLLRPCALEALRGCSAIIHAGDIGGARLTGPAVLDLLAALAPVHAVRGNNDREPALAALPLQLDLDFDGVRVRVLHDAKALHGDVAAEGVQVVVSGHSHRPQVHSRDGVLFVNPGSAGPRRFKLPVSVAVLELARGRAGAHCIALDPATPIG